MKTLMIVEDEKLCLESLLQIPWETIEVKVIGTARNGSGAIEKIKQTPPDIVLTDIEMEDGNGFTLANELTYRFPNIKIIFLTAHDKFEYAQKAISYKAFAFILKPINQKILLDTVLEAKNKIEDENIEHNQYEQLLTDFSNCKYFLKYYFFSSISNNHIDEIKTMFEINKDGIGFQTILISHFDSNGIVQAIDFKFFTEIITALTPYGFSFIPFYEHNMLTYIIQSAQSDIIEKSFEAANIISGYMKYHDSMNFTVAIGSAVNNIKQLSFCEKRAQEALKYRFSIGENEVIYIDDIEPAKFSMSNIDELKARLIDNIKIANISQAKKAVSEIFESMQTSHTSLDLTQRICLELVIMMSIAMAQLGEQPKVLFNKTEIWSLIKTYQSMPSLEKFISDISETAISVISAKREDKNNSIVERAIELIKCNMETDVSLETIASQIPISSTYLSSMFKNKTGVSYKNYITQIRLNKAKELLLNTDLPIYEIASKTGYKDQRHFSTLFQSKVGMLPTEYRKHVDTNL